MNPRNEISPGANGAEVESITSKLLEQIIPFDAEIQPADILRLEHEARHIQETLLDHKAHLFGMSTDPAWDNPLMTARSYEAALNCLLAHSDDGDSACTSPCRDPADLAFEYVQGWCALWQPGAAVTPLTHALALQQWDRYGGRSIPLPGRVRGLAELIRSEPAAPRFVLPWLLPEGQVTLLASHGGIGKSMLAETLAACAVAAHAFLGLPVERQRVIYYSAEDDRDILLYRLAKICRALGIDPDELEGNLHLLDMTDRDPTLYRGGKVTEQYRYLGAQIRAHGTGLVIIDNASDVYDDNEISRPRVREFLRHLRQLNCTTLLLSHVDKATARAGGGSESYSGSTAWNNSVRSRLALTVGQDGTVMLEHLKSNHGQLLAPIRLAWTDGVLALATAQASDDPLPAILRLIDEFTQRGEFIATATNSTRNAYRMLDGEPGFPKYLTRASVTQLLRQAERDGLLGRENYVSNDRKRRERWQITPLAKNMLCAMFAPTADL
ncbi:MAG: AAA family ATPase [Thiobacillaceae bacterium]